MIFHKRPPQPTPTPARWEFFTNLAAPGEFVNGFEEQKTAARVCPLSHTPKKEVTNMTDAKIAALRAETAELKSKLQMEAVKYVKSAQEHQQRMADAKRAGEEIKLAGDMKQWGIRFV